MIADHLASSADPRLAIATEPMHRRQVAAVAVATALNALDGFDVLSISFAAPGIARDWAVDRAALGVVLSMELIGMAFGSILLGTVADRWGRRPTTLLCLFVMTVGMALASVSGDLLMLSAVRLFTGLGIGGMLATTNAIVAEFTSDRRRNLAVAIMAGGYPVGAIVGGAVASLLLATTGRWQSVFAFGAIVTAAFVPLVLWLVPETIAFLCARQPKGALERVNRTLRLQDRPAIAALPARSADEHRGGTGEVLSPAMRRITLTLMLAYFCHIMTFYFLMKWIPKVVADMGFDPATAGSVLVWANVGGASGSLAMSLATQRVPVRRLVGIGMVVGAAAVTAFGQSAHDLVSLSLTAAVAGFFVNGATAGLYAVVAGSFPARLRGGGTGFVIGIGRGGAALGPVLAGLLLSAQWPLGWVALAMATGSLAASLFLATLPANRRASGNAYTDV